LSETTAGPESTRPGTVFQPDQAAPSQVIQRTSPEFERTKASSVLSVRTIAAGAYCVFMPPGSRDQPLQAEPL
jgi:hypothetical protein